MSKTKKYTSIGGSALIEGVMMRGNDRMAIALRRNDGSIQLKVEALENKAKWYGKVPILRGIVTFILSMMTSYKSLMYSADVSMEGLEEPENPSKVDKFLDKLLGKAGMAIIGVVAMVLGVALALLLFMYLPSLVTNWLMKDWHPALKAVIEGLMKILIFLGYISLTSLMSDMRRVYQYHGGEHKSIFCFEAKRELNPENAMACKRFHPRCGTSFILLTLILSIVISMFIPWGSHMIVRALLKLCFIPAIMGLAYEFIRYAGKHDNIVTKIFSAPGLWFQRITTREPDEKQIAVALVALKGVLNDYPLNKEIIVDEEGNYLKDKEEKEEHESEA